jgi:hypothetical protein
MKYIMTAYKNDIYHTYVIVQICSYSNFCVEHFKKNQVMKTINLHQLLLTFTLILCIHISYSQVVYTNLRPNENYSCKKFGCTHLYPLDVNNDGVTDFELQVSKTGQILLYNATVSVLASTGNAIANYGAALSGGTLINSSLIWTTSATLRSYRDYSGFGGPKGFYGSWSTGTDQYLGLRFNLGADSFYGWVRLNINVSTSSASLTIKDYAFDNTVNHSIQAGSIAGARFSSDQMNNQMDTELNVFPNPANLISTISITLDKVQHVVVSLSDIHGKLLKQVYTGNLNSGYSEFNVDISNLSSGIYFYKIESDNNIIYRKLFIQK